MLTGKKIKYLFVLSSVMILCGILIGCSGKNEAAKDVPVHTIEERIKQVASMEDMEKGDMNRLKKLYHLDPDEVQDFVLYTAESNVEANELAVIKVKQENQAESVKEKIMKRIEAQEVKLKDYRPEQFYLVEKHVLKVKGLYILFTVSKDAEKIESAFDKAFK
ncbi:MULTISPECIES: DUF4358 domain-containing protein [unclassified Paenibacillus]|uniref:DUF4358 domain-containing protein n=1 Tax=unclassified Paenibacillus TaxID=185978 RepID=UPI00041B39F3|nr:MULTISPECIES: DUF4358 domain-containing protein [unclassified Paenibacillus]KGP80680.1 hypothetical protein P364_0118855 [Paenibacillus sp. MAEPY2]KGP88443.1 hypothetical protein P363_0106880 [Paenibacillus sp. MAEPY1]